MRLLVAAGVTIAVIAVAVVVLPTRAWYAQQRTARQARAELAAVRSANERLRAKIERLGDDRSIERQAREQFGLVFPGEESYTVPPPGPPAVNLPRVWPFDLLQEPLARAADQRR